jgi:hypothetical protein
MEGSFCLLLIEKLSKYQPTAIFNCKCRKLFLFFIFYGFLIKILTFYFVFELEPFSVVATVGDEGDVDFVPDGVEVVRKTRSTVINLLVKKALQMKKFSSILNRKTCMIHVSQINVS